jgi:hypothetical protein
MAAFILGIVDVFRGAPLYGALSLATWYAGITALGLGVDLDERARTGLAWLGIAISATFSVLGALHR